MYNIAIALLNAEKYEEAVPYFERAATRGHATLGPDHPQVAEAPLYLAQTRVELGEDDRARTDLREALRILEKNPPSPRPSETRATSPSTWASSRLRPGHPRCD